MRKIEEERCFKTTPDIHLNNLQNNGIIKYHTSFYKATEYQVLISMFSLIFYQSFLVVVKSKKM